MLFVEIQFKNKFLRITFKTQGDFFFFFLMLNCSVPRVSHITLVFINMFKANANHSYYI